MTRGGLMLSIRTGADWEAELALTERVGDAISLCMDSGEVYTFSLAEFLEAVGEKQEAA